MQNFLTLILMLLLTACSSNDNIQNPVPAPDTVKVKRDIALTTSAGLMIVNMDVQEFKTTLDGVKNKNLLDVRTTDEYAAGHLVDAINIDVDANDFEKKISGLDKTLPFFVYCQGGSRSRVACKHMQQLGFTNLYNLSNGIESWKDAGFDFVK